MQTYSKEFPRHIRNNLPFGIRRLTYSNHALRRASEEGYRGIVGGNLPQTINMEEVEVYEVESPRKGVVHKVMIRLPLMGDQDMVLAACPERGGLFVKSLWPIRNDRKLYKLSGVA